jgi:hypothetical protein
MFQASRETLSRRFGAEPYVVELKLRFPDQRERLSCT